MKHLSRTYQGTARSTGRTAAGVPGLRPHAGLHPIDRGEGAPGESALRSPAACFSSASHSGLILLIAFVLVLTFFSPAGAVPPGTTISNTASVTYISGGTGMTSVSNTVSVTTVVFRTPSTLELLQYAPASPSAQPVPVSPTEYSTSGTAAGPFSPLGPPVPAGGGAAIPLASPVPLVAATVYHEGEPVFVRLTDPDQNLDALVRETVLVTVGVTVPGEQEVLRLTETGPDTGVFTGYIQTGPLPASAGNGVLNVQPGSTLTATYVDAADGTDTESRAALIDPFGMVFDSLTGQPVNGALVSIVDAATGLPATVHGDDGLSSFPSSIVSGGTATDSSGTVYTFSPGEYRFPFIAPGRYRIDVTPPAGYRAPSSVPASYIQNLPGGPFALVDPGSRGEEFLVNPGPAIHIDIPVDPVGSGLWLGKTAGKTAAAPGDFVPYTLTVENTDASAIVPGVTVADRLPPGFRYMKGSSRLNGAAMPDPSASPDGRTLTFSAGDLGAGGRALITYVASVGAGASPGKATNSAAAQSLLGAVSNTATAAVMVTEDLFRSTATIAGRVSVDGCGDRERSEEHGLEGVRILLEDGSSVVTDRNGRFHFAAVNPGTHVVQIDPASIAEKYEILACEQNTRFAGEPGSQFVDLPGGALWRADFHLALRPKKTGETGIELRSSLPPERKDPRSVPLQQRRQGIAYAAPFHVGGVPARNARLTVLLPEGVVYVPGSSRLDAAPVGDPEVRDNSVTFRLGAFPAGHDGTIRFDASVPALGENGKIVTKALLTFDTPDEKNARTPVVENVLVRETVEDQQAVPDIVLRPHFPPLSLEQTRRDRRELDRVIRSLSKVVVQHITVTGHTDSLPITGPARKLFADNYALSTARAKSVADYLAEKLRLAPDQVTIVGKGSDEPIADNGTAKGRALNRRVEIRIETKRIVVFSEVRNDVGSSGMWTVATTGLRPGEIWPEEQKAVADPAAMPDYNEAWLAAARPGVAWLWPPEGDHPAIAATKIAVQHDAATTVRLLLNGTEVDPLYAEGTVKNADGSVAVSIWKGVHLADGDNRFEAVLYDGSGAETDRIGRTIHYSGPPVKAELVPERSRLIADGRKPSVFAVRFLDQDGQPARRGTLGDFRVDPPYIAQKVAAELQQSPLTAPASDRVQYEVGENGIALIELAPTMRTGEAVLRFALGNGPHEVRAWLKPEVRDWVLVGLAEGTVGYNTVTGNMDTLAASGADDRLYENGRLAFYAKGRIKGEWLLTLAYDSAKKENGQGSLYQTIDPNKYYLLYGDATDQQFDAPSSRHVYVKLERDQFYALFGDYDTGLTVTELSRYSRNLTGFKSEYKGDRADATVFASDTSQAFVKDEIPGDGTSGLYRLSRKNIVINSESVVIETRDRFRSERVLSTQRLTRFLDYTIDCEEGTIFFKYPVFSRDADFNPVYIVATYESLDGRDKSYTYGGRGALRFLDKRIEVGSTFVHEGRVGGSADLTGLDATVRLSDATKLRAEAAGTKTGQYGGTADGTAYLAEITHQSPKMNGSVYVREQGSGFGLGQQNGSETGTRKTGFDLAYRFTDRLSMKTQAFRQETFGTGAVRDMAEIEGRYTARKYEYFLGLRHARDAFDTGEVRTSDQVYTGLRYRMTDRLTLRVQHDQLVADRGGNSTDYPTRTTVGADYRLTKETAIFADQELTRGSDKDTATSRVGFRSSPWTGAQVSSTMEQQSTESGTRLFSTTGLKQAWKLTKRWSLDVGLDRSATIRKTGGFLPNPNVPPASGGEDFTAVTAGAGYRAGQWTWTGRVETRRAESYDKFGVYTGANGEPAPGIGLAASFQGFWTGYATGARQDDRDLRLGFAYRPLVSRWIVLDRLDHRLTRQRDDSVNDDSWRVVNNLVLNYTVPGSGQASFQYGAKYVREMIDGSAYSGYTDLTGMEGRYDVAKTIDIGLRGSMLRSRVTGQTQYGSAVSAGFTMAKNLWLSVGYNLTGFYDRDFSQADFTARGPFIKLRMKFDQASVREAIKWFTGQ